MPPSRPLYGLERVWLVADRLWPPFVIDLVVEGTGDLDPARWQAALNAVLPAWPGARARLRGILGWTRWVADGAPPIVTEVDGGAWEARSPAPFAPTRLDPHVGPIVELVLVSGTTPRIILRTHHAAFDGRATWALAEDLGAALRGEPIRGAAFADLSDVALIGDGPSAVEPPADAVAPTGACTSQLEASTWTRVTLPPLQKRVLRRVLGALAASSEPGRLRVSLPVDLRRHHDGLRASANLTGFVRVDARQDPIAALEAALHARIESEIVRTAHALRSVPLAVMESAGRNAGLTTLRTGLAATSATLTNLGHLDASVFDGAGFRGASVFVIPPTNPGTPLFLTLTGHPGGIELCGGMPVGFASGGRLEALLAAMALHLTGSD